ncbi:LysR family transcriptional regulator [Loktanella sp. SALINAS62]|uniref:LysR family transcriptional regulator n=1 Tax=Loktanella sp. SALINAS62 TaxID=2706124 RepID=UPI001B8D13E6|nr:LysR family transcriptional regulator [Loktanella sp. SALINAS62]MBS1302650.1 LysR family transcriptional regulator [Loktanella sp. SALINAS62]
MDTRQLQTLIAVADTGSFASAARLVNLTASAVSQQIQTLEIDIGVSLFDRNKRPPQMNAHGEELVRAARTVMQTIVETRMNISGRRTAGVLKIGAIRTVSMRLVPLALADMAALYTDLSFDLTVGISQSLTADVAAGRLDAALVAEHVGVPAGLSWTPVLSEPLVLVAPAHATGQTELSLLKNLPFIRYETDVPLARQIATELSRLGVSPREIAVANTMPSVVGMVQAGLGFAIIPQIAFLDAAPSSLYCIQFRNGAITRRVGLVQRQVSSRSEVLQELRNILSQRTYKIGPKAAEIVSFRNGWHDDV